MCIRDRSIVTLSGVLKKDLVRNASKPEWSKDSRSIYFFREITPKDSASSTFIPVATICSLPVADANGRPIVSKVRRDLAQCAGDVFTGGRIHALEAVSYTHLDVYKRQGGNRSTKVVLKPEQLLKLANVEIVDMAVSK